MQKPSVHTIKKYFDNEASLKEAEQVINWLATKEGEAYLEKQFFDAENDSHDEASYLFESEALQQIEEKIKKQEAKTNWLKKRDKRNKPLMAAAMLVMLFVALPFLHFVVQKNEITEVSPPKKIEVRENPKGQKSSLSLPDGSTIKLNAESRIEFEEGLAGQERRVKLFGEAYFDVAEDTTRPFIVLVRDSIKVEALGTSFNIKAFKDEDNIEVALTTGKVRVSNEFEILNKDEKDVCLTPGLAYNFNKITGEAIKRKFDLATSLAWLNGKLLFNDASFSEIEYTLERWYGVEFSVKKNKLRIPHFTGEFKDETLKNVLENVSIACNFKYAIDGKDVTVY